MGRKRKRRRQSHGSAWLGKQTDCWYYTMPGTRKRVCVIIFTQLQQWAKALAVANFNVLDLLRDTSMLHTTGARGGLPAAKSGSWTRVIGFSGRPVRGGVRWGGRQQNLLLKSLSLEPAVNARGRRINLADDDLLRLSLDTRETPFSNQPRVESHFRFHDKRDTVFRLVNTGTAAEGQDVYGLFTQSWQQS